MRLTTGVNMETLRLRPHHIFCDRFLPLDNLIRGKEFACAVNKIKELTQSESDLIITVTEGQDQLCYSCPDYKNNRCENPIGNEESVRKWDSKILKGLDNKWVILTKDNSSVIAYSDDLDYINRYTSIYHFVDLTADDTQMYCKT